MRAWNPRLFVFCLGNICKSTFRIQLPQSVYPTFILLYHSEVSHGHQILSPPKDKQEQIKIMNKSIDELVELAKKMGSLENLWWLPILYRAPQAAPLEKKDKYFQFHQDAYQGFLALRK
jgi:hypothetical protein